MFAIHSFLTTLCFFIYILEILSDTPPPAGVLLLELGTEVRGRIDQDRWIFYQFTIPANRGFIIHLEHALGVTKNHDLDLYVRKGGLLPDRVTFDYSDASISANVTINGKAEPTQTVYIVGVYGFIGQNTPFSIIVSATNGCPFSCNNRGTCLSGTCSCYTGYSGDHCQFEAIPVALGNIYNGTVRIGLWRYYSVDVLIANNLIVDVYQKIGDVDLYIQYGTTPDISNYRYSDFSHSKNINISIVQPFLGTWYLGFFGFALDSSFTFSVYEVQTCPMRCSLHGSCVGLNCRCSPEYVGQTCEERRQALTLGTTVSGFVDENYWNYFKFDTSSDRAVKVILKHAPGANCDMFVLDNAKPTIFFNLYNNVSTAPETYVIVGKPDFNTWWIGVYGVTQCIYNLTLVAQSTTSPCGTCVNGLCVENQCNCSKGWVGQNCDVSPAPLVNGVKTNDKLTKNMWTYFEIDTSNTSQLIVVLEETKTIGLAWLYLSVSGYPTLASFEASNSDTSSSVHRIVLEFSAPKSQRFVIGCYGSPFIVEQEVVVNLVAYYLPF